MNVFYKSAVYFLISSLYLLCSIPAISQEVLVNESLAIEYFKEGNYEKALPLFTRLINKSPDNAMYNYYYGVTLLKNNLYETATKEALLNAVVDKTPANSSFYLGNYFHALENWSEAIDFYKRYNGSKQERRELEYDKYLDLCMKRINPFKVDKGDEKKVFGDTLKVPVSLPDEKNFPIPDSLKSEWFNFPINNQLTYHSITDFRSEAAKILFTKAWIATGKNDSIVKNTDILRKAHEETHNVTARIGLVQRIVEAEQLSYQLLREREKYFEQARVKESGYWEKAGVDAMATFIQEIAQREQARGERLLSEKKKTEVTPVEIAVAMPVTEDAKTENQPVKTDPPLLIKDKIVFKVQIGSFPKGKITPVFKTKYAKLSKLRKIDKYTDSKKNEVYTIGNFTEYKDAALLKNQLIIEGAKGAYVAAYKNGERVPVTSVIKELPSK
ncbi:MAG: tetratricopeptide repeat protein [Mariniphaga sp.]